MPRRLIQFTAGQYYHLYNRGVNRGRIFFDPKNYQLFLSRVERYLMPVADLISYCLMPTHYHLIICVKMTSEMTDTSEVKLAEIDPSSEISRAMMRLLVSYTRCINQSYDRVGTLFQGAFQAKEVLDDAYLGQLIDYLHLNPVASGLVEDPGDWPYSSYRLQIDLRDKGNLRGQPYLGGPRPLTRL